ncbi:hypothetical protein RQP46_005890 [Phenoliferia psychrophenolica]
MQSLTRRTARLTLHSRRPIASSSTTRTLATHSTLPSPPTTPASPSAAPRSKYVVAPKALLTKASRLSPSSSRVTGRRAPNPLGRNPLGLRKSLSPLLPLSPSSPIPLQFTTGLVKIFLPSVFIRLVRNTGSHTSDPYTATFRTDLRLTKPDISNYLQNIYNLSISSLRTMNYSSPLKRNPIGGGYSRGGGTKSYKKVIVTMTEPFWYPEERGREWCNEHFQREAMEEMRDRKMLKIGDGAKYGVNSERYRGAGKLRKDVDRLKAIATAGGSDLAEEVGDGKSAQRRPSGRKMRKNVVRSRAERIDEKKSVVEMEMDRLRDAGWQRRTMADLAGLFASVGEDVNGTRSAPLRLLPELIDKFELLRGITLLGPDEKDAMRAFALANPDQSIGPDDLSMLLGMVNLPSTGTTLTSDPPTPPSPSPSRLSSAPSLSSDPFLDPAPSRRPRTLSSRSSTPTSNNPSRIPSPSTPSPSSSTNSSPSKTNANASKRTSFLSRLKSSSSSTLSRRSSIGGGGGGGEKEKDRTDLSDLARGHSYLGVELDGPLGEDFDATEEADKLRAATKGVGTRESIVIEILADKTFPQLRAIESVYVEKYDKTLAELIASEGALKSNLGKVLRGLVLGPLGFDVDLLIRATDTAIKPNEHLLTELLVSRPPSELSLLRTAFARRLDPTSSSRSSTTLNDAVLRSFAGNARLRKVWEIVLAGKWDDEGASVGEDVDQLRVALRARPANLDVVTKILFARSPDRIHAIVTEFKKPAASTGGASKGSLTKAIKLAVPVGQLRSMLLFAVEGAKNDQDGVWRDSKLLMASMEGVGTRNDELLWRIVRAHWDRPRFKRIAAAYRDKYKKPLIDRVHSETSSHFQHVLEAILQSTTRPYPMKNALRQIQDLSRKLKDSEERYQQTSSTFEEEHAELESRLDDARSDLLAKVRENKELRNSEKAHMDSIVSLEADVAKLTKQAERNREQYELMKRNYQDQCTEAEKLRTLVAETRRENRMQEEAAHNHGLQVQQFERDRELLQQAITKLEEDLGVARRAQDHLDDQKQENLLLKETIDRLRFDMDELRGAGRKSVYVDGSGGASADSSVAGSLSRTLGAEIGRQQRERESSEEADEADSDEEINDIVVTTHRRVKKRATKPIGGGPASPSITRVEETTIVCDADTQTERVRTTSMDIQTDLAAVTVELVAAPAVEPLVVVPPKSPYEVQEELASGLGIELAQLQDFISGRKKQANSTAPPQPQQPQSTSRSSSATEAIMSSRRYGRWGSRLSRVGQAPSYIIGAFPPAARPFVSQVLDTSTAFCLYSVCLYLAGVVSGGLLFPLTHQHHMGPFHVLVSPGDRAQWHQYNTFGSSWGEGLSTGGANAHGAGATWSYWLQEVIWGGVSVARRFPS